MRAAFSALDEVGWQLDPEKAEQIAEVSDGRPGWAVLAAKDDKMLAERLEQQAAADATRVLTQEDPPPQTIYRVIAKAGDPVLVKVRLQYRAGRGR